MRHVIAGTFIGFILAAAFLAACGSGSVGDANATIAQLTQQIADLQQDVADLTARGDAHEADVNGAHFSTPYVGLHYCICLEGTYPPRTKPGGGDDTYLTGTEHIGSVSLFAGNFAPRNWAFCEGQLLEISSYDALFSIIGTTYGGDGRTNFALPDLRGRVVVGVGTDAGLPTVDLGERGYR